MEKYNVLKVDSLQDCFLVIANTYENPINDLLCDGDVSFIENGDVIFDLAVINGINFNRFIQVTVESHRLQAKTIKVISDVPTSILEISEKYFKTHKEVIQQSTLPSATKYLLTNAYMVWGCWRAWARCSRTTIPPHGGHPVGQ